jgi:hypothetical protein
MQPPDHVSSRALVDADDVPLQYGLTTSLAVIQHLSSVLNFAILFPGHAIKSSREETPKMGHREELQADSYRRPYGRKLPGYDGLRNRLTARSTLTRPRGTSGVPIATRCLSPADLLRVCL